MFKLRLVTSLFLVLLVLAGIFWAPQIVFLGGVLVTVAIAANEWGKLAGVERIIWRILYAVLLLYLILDLLYATLDLPQISYSIITVITVIAALLWLLALLSVRIYPRGSQLWRRTWLTQLAGFFFIAACALNLIWLKSIGVEQGYFWLLVPFIIVWMADTGAYVVGKTCGRHPLIPEISPGKTIEGACGGLLAVWIAAVIAGVYHGLPGLLEWAVWLGIATLLTGVAMLGDLFVSLLKRIQNLKDSGHLLPGHGGMLDRIDSLLAVVPCYMLLLMELQGI